MAPMLQLVHPPTSLSLDVSMVLVYLKKDDLLEPSAGFLIRQKCPAKQRIAQ
jgi:hypothetical protein